MITLRKTKSFMYEGVFSYYILYDYMSGKDDRYTVMIRNPVDDPTIIGREIDLKSTKELIAEYEAEAKQLPYMGDKKDVLKIVKKITEQRRKEFKCAM